ncbi:ubiquinone biosynthesis O-methyltransferase, mitochondrial [Dioscorea cayenensis subsp. rotundata]|uniref:Ubiquinone biosynthesis O-methyltransferase, mitochondrial n=1 Tax=Dioscorea cayennensis subsp. rotundata TaxID=55577 RepID=A0AB40CVA1_DIOCR|nr:ubiquinone biosynthesis O-methyltransferase, mitochondrial [Dioscorea cayenensis subsp. rotundata]
MAATRSLQRCRHLLCALASPFSGLRILLSDSFQMPLLPIQPLRLFRRPLQYLPLSRTVEMEIMAPFALLLTRLKSPNSPPFAETWWDFEGPFKPLHQMNPTRISFIRSALCRHFRKDPFCARPFEGLKVIDVGCGGGILSEPLARMGASVTGIDAVEKNINIARIHAESDPLTSSIEYRCTTAEQLVKENKKFDAVIALEVIEHVADPSEFCKSLAALTAPNGATVISSISRTMRAFATAIVAAEYLLRWLPKGTHDWSSFLTPEELVLILQRTSISVKEMAGISYNPVTGEWSLSDDIGVNFIAYGAKEGDVQ